MPNFLIITLTIYIVIVFLFIISSMQYIKKYKGKQGLGSLINDCLALYLYTNSGVIIFGLITYIMSLFIFTQCILLLTKT